MMRKMLVAILATLAMRSALAVTYKYTWNEDMQGYVLTEYSCEQGETLEGDIALPTEYLGHDVVALGQNAFCGAKSIRSVQLPERLIELRGGVFTDCTSLESITIPSTLKKMGSGQFNGCSRLAEVNITDLAAWCQIAYDGEDWNVLTSKQYADTRLVLNGKTVTNVVIPDGVPEISANAFRGYLHLNTLTLPSSVTNVDSYAFMDCANLRSLSWGADRKHNAPVAGKEWSFYNCEKLTDVHVYNLQRDEDGDWNCTFQGCPVCNVSINVSTAYPGSMELSSQPTNVTFVAGVTEIPTDWTGAIGNANCLQKVTLPSTVTNIADRAFCQAQKTLREINLPEGLKSIGDEAFRWCENLVGMAFPSTLEVIGMMSFKHCGSLTTVDLPDSLRQVGYEAFSCCEAVTSITMPRGPCTFGENVFGGCDAIEDICIRDLASWCSSSSNQAGHLGLLASENEPRLLLNGAPVVDCVIPDGVTSIAEEAFYGYSHLRTLALPSSVTNIGFAAFADCENLMLATLGVDGKHPDNVVAMNCSFSNCSNLTDMHFYNAVAYDDGYSFYGCDSIVNVSLNLKGGLPCNVFEKVRHQITNIVFVTGTTALSEGSGFCGDGLVSVTIPDVVTNITGTFSGCYNLTDVKLPSALRVIGAEAFSSCEGLTELTLPSNVCYIGDSAFSGCCQLTELTLPDAVRSLGDYAFASCEGLETITLNNGLKTIGEFCFSYCTGLTTVTLPDTLSVVGKCAFRDCEAITDVHMPTDVTALSGIGIFTGCDSLARIHIKDLAYWCEQAWTEHSWNDEEGIPCSLLAPVSPKYINRELLLNGTRVTKLAVPSTVESIAPYAFGGYSYLKSVTFPSSVTSIGAHAFESIINLQTIEIPMTVKDIGACAFKGCIIWGDVTIPCFLNTFGSVPKDDAQPSDVFQDASCFGCVYFPCGEMTLRHIFPNCYTGIENASFAPGSSGLVAGAFKDCSALTHVTLPYVDGALPSDAFSGCSALTVVSVPTQGMVLPVRTALISSEVSSPLDVSIIVRGGDDPLPELPAGATSDDVREILQDAADPHLVAYITDVATYNEFRTWALSVPGGATAVFASSYAWVSFVFDSATLLERWPTDDDLAIVSFEPSTTDGLFEFVVRVEDVTVGENARTDDLRKVIRIAGASTLDVSTFSSKYIALFFNAPVEGKVKLTAGPSDVDTQSFFMQAKSVQ